MTIIFSLVLIYTFIKVSENSMSTVEGIIFKIRIKGGIVLERKLTGLNIIILLFNTDYYPFIQVVHMGVQMQSNFDFYHFLDQVVYFPVSLLENKHQILICFHLKPTNRIFQNILDKTNTKLI